MFTRILDSLEDIRLRLKNPHVLLRLKVLVEHGCLKLKITVSVVKVNFQSVHSSAGTVE